MIHVLIVRGDMMKMKYDYSKPSKPTMGSSSVKKSTGTAGIPGATSSKHGPSKSKMKSTKASKG